MTPKG
jgi:hypothetical protein